MHNHIIMHNLYNSAYYTQLCKRMHNHIIMYEMHNNAQ